MERHPRRHTCSLAACCTTLMRRITIATSRFIADAIVTINRLATALTNTNVHRCDAFLSDFGSPLDTSFFFLAKESRRPAATCSRYND